MNQRHLGWIISRARCSKMYLLLFVPVTLGLTPVSRRVTQAFPALCDSFLCLAPYKELLMTSFHRVPKKSGGASVNSCLATSATKAVICVTELVHKQIGADKEPKNHKELSSRTVYAPVSAGWARW